MRRLLLILALCGLAAAGTALAAAPNPANQARLESTIRYLQEVQNADGGFGGDSGRESGQGFSAWVALALGAAGINPRCQAKPGGVDAFTFLADHFERGLEEEIPYPAIPTTAYERELMVVKVAGTDPHSFAGRDLVAEILARQLPDGSFPFVPGGVGSVNNTIFAILSLAPVHEPAVAAAIPRAADWVEANQRDDGSWAWKDRESEGEVDMTGAAIQALQAAGRDGTAAGQAGIEYLREAQLPDGGFPAFPREGESNVASTAWAVQALWAVGENPETWLVEGKEPLSYLASMQQPDGHIRWKASQDMNGVWMTAFVAPAFAGQALPIPPAPLPADPGACLPAAPPPGSGADQGGLSPESGTGVISGGRGRGAALFSRPKHGSKGRTPGGVQQVRSERRATNHSATRRGENATQSTATATTEAQGEREAAAAAASWGDGGGDGATASGAGAGVAVAGAGRSSGSGASAGQSVSGEVIGTAADLRRSGGLGFGAPGLRGAGAGDDGGLGLAIGIGVGAALLALLGSRLEIGGRLA